MRKPFGRLNESVVCMSDTHHLRRLSYPALALLEVLVACSQTAPAPTPELASPTPPTVTAVVAADPYHPPARDTVEVAVYRGWQQLMLQCARCHGDDAQGTSFAPSLVLALRPDGHIPTRDDFLRVLINGRQDKGMPSAAKLGLDSVYFDGLYQYLKGRSDGRFRGGRPARREN
jgi:mono/diheme cytochrome c family protein